MVDSKVRYAAPFSKTSRWGKDVVSGRGLHSSTFKYNLRRFVALKHRNHPAHPPKGADVEPKNGRV